MKEGGALERLAGKGKAGKDWAQVVRRVASLACQRPDVNGRLVREGAQSRCKRLGRWERSSCWDWALVAWAEAGELKLGIPVSGPGGNHAVFATAQSGHYCTSMDAKGCETA